MPPDTALYSGEMWVMVHELTHFLEFRNDPQLPQVLTVENAELLFQTESDWNAYLFGYRFSTFLHENYGEDIYLRLIHKVMELEESCHLSGQQITPEQCAQIVKAATTAMVFTDFAQWYRYFRIL